MLKVYRAIYKTDWIYAEGYIVVRPDNTIEGVFALDYMYIYEYDKHSFCFLKTLSYYTQNQVCISERKAYEFYSSKHIFRPFETYFFFNNSSNGLFLEINEEITDIEDIKIILMDIAMVQA